MRKTIVVLDNFYSHPDLVRNYALRHKYYYPSRKVDGHPGGSVGEKINHASWNTGMSGRHAEGKAMKVCNAVLRSSLWNCSFHVKFQSEQELGEGQSRGG